MTCIIGMVQDGDVYMGADSQTVYGWAIHRSAHKKVFKRKNLLIGCAGDVRMNNLLQYNLDIPVRKSDQTDQEYIVVEVVNAIRKCFKENGYLTVDNNKEAHNSECLIGYHSELYKIGVDFSVLQFAHGIGCIGSGEDFALAAMVIQKKQIIEGQPDSIHVCSMITQALEVSAELSMGVSAPFYVEMLPKGE